MTTTTVTTQAELDAALANLDTYEIVINSPAGVWLAVSSTGNKYVRAFGSATVRAFEATDDQYAAGQDHGRRTVYTVGTSVVADDWEPTHECGGGLHLSPTPEQATWYREGAARWLRCTVALADLYPIHDPHAPAKAKCRTVRVEAEVDSFGRELAAAR